MHVTIKLFGQLRDFAGQNLCVINVPLPTTLEKIRDEFVRLFPQAKPLLARSHWAVDREYATLTTTIQGTEELAIIPPVSGG
jgi:molybdopterin converting factor small subunit